MKDIRWGVVTPTVLIVFVTLALYLLFPKQASAIMTSLSQGLLSKTHLMYTLGTAFIFLLCCVLAMSPLGKIKLGGATSQPMMSTSRWFFIVFCTTTAVGILFWSCAEPVYHLSSPPQSLGILPYSTEAQIFALKTVIFHWTLIPYALYTLPAVLFAYAYFNNGRSFSFSSCFLSQNPLGDRVKSFIDSTCIYTLVFGMSASLAAGVMTVDGGIQKIFLTEGNHYLLITIFIACCFVFSSWSGIQRGVTYLSQVNIFLVFFLFVSLLWVSPLGDLLSLYLTSLKELLIHFPQNVLLTQYGAEDPWPRNWTLFYWSNWFSWAPLSALFLGSLCRGRTIRQAVVMNLFIPSFVCSLWIALFSGSVILSEGGSAGSFSTLLQTKGPEMLVYHLIQGHEWAGLLIPLFLLTALIAYITAADSNTYALAELSEQKILSSKMKLVVKCFWGTVIAAVSFALLQSHQIDGIKAISTLGGFPVLILEIVFGGGFLFYFFKNRKQILVSQV